VAAFAADLLQRGSAVIVVWDFNAFARSRALRPLREVGFEHALPPSATGSYHFHAGVTLWPRIDHVLTSEELESMGGALLYTRDETGFPSDHFPALATLRWRENAIRQ
jgi:endonuclease/exonuclease/phosphatase (EEP) superfamily protein YafD